MIISRLGSHAAGEAAVFRVGGDGHANAMIFSLAPLCR